MAKVKTESKTIITKVTLELNLIEAIALKNVCGRIIGIENPLREATRVIFWELDINKIPSLETKDLGTEFFTPEHCEALKLLL